MTDDLTAWLHQQLDTDERVAREAIGPVGPRWKAEGCRVEVDGDTKGRDVFEWTVCFDEGSPSGEEADHIARHDPARVLAEVDAKRQLLDCIVGATGKGSSRLVANDEPWAIGGDHLVRLLALPYADREGYREEWKP